MIGCRSSLPKKDYLRWLGKEPDPRDLMILFPPEPMRMWPISMRVNKPENDHPSIVDPVVARLDQSTPGTGAV
jgi:putative SOS response-associated peptidase YedK